MFLVLEFSLGNFAADIKAKIDSHLEACELSISMGLNLVHTPLDIFVKYIQSHLCMHGYWVMFY